VNTIPDVIMPTKDCQLENGRRYSTERRKVKISEMYAVPYLLTFK